jgi:WD40 repeat protein
MATGAKIQILEGHSSPVIALAFSPDETQRASGSWGWRVSKDTAVRVWDTATGGGQQIFET